MATYLFHGICRRYLSGLQSKINTILEEMARKSNLASLPPVLPMVEEEENTIYDSDFSPSSDEPDSERDTKQNSRFSYNKSRKVAATRHPYAMAITNNRPKKVGKVNGIIRQNVIKDSDSIVEKAKSQRRLKLHELQNEIQLLKTKQKDFENENKLLKRTQRRQAAALKRYEGNEGELPSLLRSHQEEVRTLRELLKKSNEKQRISEKRETEKAIELEKARIQLQRLQAIVREQHLDERISLNKKVDFLQIELKEKETKIREMQHHLELRDKNYKHQLAIEFARHKDTKKKLHEIQVRVDKLSVTLKEKERELEIKNIYTAHIANKSPRKPRSLSPNRKAQKEFKKLIDSNSLEPDFKQDEKNDTVEPSDFFYTNSLENLQIKQRNALPNISEMKPQSEEENSENPYNFMDVIRRKSLTKETCVENADKQDAQQKPNVFLNPLPAQTRSEEIVSDTSRDVKHRQEFKIWVSSSRPVSADSNDKQITTSTLETKPLSAKSKKSNLMMQLFGNVDDDNSGNISDFPTPTKPDSAIRSSSDSCFLLPRRPREKSNVLPKQMMSPIPGSIEDETSPLLL